MEPTQTELEVRGIRFACLQWGGRGPLALCIHGFPDTPHSWAGVAPALVQLGYRVVAPFTRGYAPTSAPADGDYHGIELARDVIALAEALDDDPCLLLAHDWGAAAAYGAVNLAPERFTKFVAVAIPHPRTLRPNLSLLWGMRHFFFFALPGWPEAWLRKDDFAALDELFQRWSPSWRGPAPTEVKACFARPGTVEAALGYYRAFVRGGAGAQGVASRKASGRRTAVPTLLVGGLEDVVSPAAYEASRAGHTGPFELALLPGGHWAHIESAQAFAERVIAFAGPAPGGSDMTATLLHYPNCSTCRRARKWLTERGIDFELVDLVAEPPDAETLRGLWRDSGLPVKKLFNTSGQSYRQGDWKDRLPELSDDDKLAALAADGKLVKRPILRRGETVLVGFDAETWAEALEAPQG